MKVVIEARLPDPSGSGGVAQAIMSLATALSRLNDCRPDEEFVFVALESAGQWLDGHVSGPCRLHKMPLTFKNRISRTPFGPAARAVQRGIRRIRPLPPAGIINSDGVAESLGADMVHFPLQQGYLTELPNLYQPHDLQHIHLPQFFPAADLAWRILAYPVYCARADLVLVESTWTKEDVSRQYDIAADKIVVCPFPPPTRDYREPTAAEIAATQRKLPSGPFIFYPAQTWPHKNHLRLVEALAILKAQGVIVPLVCSGRTTHLFPEIEAAIHRLGLAEQIRFLGYVSEPEVKALYRLCAAVVVPTKFESISFPIWEAFAAGKPVACSTVTSLPAQVGDAALLFDPDEPSAMASAIKTLWQDADLRARLGKAGTARLHQFSLEGMGLHMRALYRSIAGKVDMRDKSILDARPLI